MKNIKQIIDNGDVNWFTTPVKGELKRYVIALTHNNTLSIEDIESQIKSFHTLDNINIWGWTDQETNIKYIDVSTSTNDLGEAKLLWKIFNQIAIFDLENLEEIRLK